MVPAFIIGLESNLYYSLIISLFGKLSITIKCFFCEDYKILFKKALRKYSKGILTGRILSFYEF